MEIPGHFSTEINSQVYVPQINWLLAALVLALVFGHARRRNDCLPCRVTVVTPPTMLPLVWPWTESGRNENLWPVPPTRALAPREFKRKANSKA
jgi:hypothetical protein